MKIYCILFYHFRIFEKTSVLSTGVPTMKAQHIRFVTITLFNIALLFTAPFLIQLFSQLP